MTQPPNPDAGGQQPYAQGHSPEQTPDFQAAAAGAVPSKVDIAAAVVFAAGFAITLESSSYSRTGDKVDFSYTNYGGLVAGSIMLLLGVVSFFQLRTSRPDRRVLKVLVAIAIVGLGGLHIARGLGAFASPPERSRSHIHDALGHRVVVERAPTLGQRVHDAPKDPELMSSNDGRALIEACQAGKYCKRMAAAVRVLCRKGDAEACNALAYFVHYLGVLGKPDAGKAREVFQRACDEGSQKACVNLHALFRLTSFKGKDFPANARAILDKACKANNYLACENLGTAHRRGLGGDPDIQEARRYYDRACRGGYALGCTNGGMTLYEWGTDKAAKKHARALFKRACSMGNGQGCWNLNVMAKRGEGGSADSKQAAEAAARACKLGHAHACKVLGKPVPGKATRP